MLSASNNYSYIYILLCDNYYDVEQSGNMWGF
jgi:hypothetical protein